MVDGYSNMGKILYVTPNFENVYDYKNTELLTGKIDNLLPKSNLNNNQQLNRINIKFNTKNRQRRR